MKRIGDANYRLAIGVVALVIFVPLLQWVHAQKRNPVHMTTDWSNRHMVFSQPKTMEQTWRVAGDARYGQQWLRQNPGILLPKGVTQQTGSPAILSNGGPEVGNPGIVSPVTGDPGGLEGILKDRGGNPGEPVAPGGPLEPKQPAPTPQTLRSDWGMSIQAAATAGVEMFPAKFSFDVSAAPDCTNDYVVFNTGLPSAAGVAATETGTFTANTATNGQTATITNGAASIVLYANTGASTSATATIDITSTTFLNGSTVTVGNVVYTYETAAPAAGTEQVLIGASTTTAAENLEAAINDNAADCATAGCFGTGITAANPAATVTSRVTTTDTLTAVAAGAANNFALADSAAFDITLGGLTGGVTTTGAGSNVGLNFLVGASADATATNFEAALARNDSTLGVTTVAPGANIVTVTAALPGTDGNLITYATNATGFAWAVGTTGAGQASIIAYNNLYSTQGSVGGLCATNGPSVYWSYQTSTLATKGGVVTSPVISGDGTKVAYVETSASGAVLHLLKWKAGEGTGPGAGAVPDTTLAAGESWTANCPVCQILHREHYIQWRRHGSGHQLLAIL